MLVLDHIGYVVPSIEEYLKTFFVPIAGPVAVGPIQEVPTQRVRVAFVTLKGGGRIELLEPTDERSPVMGILEKKRGGLHHVCYAVEELEKEMARFRDKGCMIVSEPAPASVFNGRRVAFVCTPQLDLIELVESAQPRRPANA